MKSHCIKCGAVKDDDGLKICQDCEREADMEFDEEEEEDYLEKEAEADFEKKFTEAKSK